MKAYLIFDNEKVDELLLAYVALAGQEIEIPDGATQFRYAVICDDPMCNRAQAIPIPRPKIKKWIWRCGNLWYTKEHFSEKEIKARSNMRCLSKVEGSGIEVEE